MQCPFAPSWIFVQIASWCSPICTQPYPLSRCSCLVLSQLTSTTISAPAIHNAQGSMHLPSSELDLNACYFSFNHPKQTSAYHNPTTLNYSPTCSLFSWCLSQPGTCLPCTTHHNSLSNHAVDYLHTTSSFIITTSSYFRKYTTAAESGFVV